MSADPRPAEDGLSKSCRLVFIVFLLLFFPLPVLRGATPSTPTPQEAEAHEPSSIRQLAYGKSGDWLYEGLQRMKAPVGRAVKKAERPFVYVVDWKKQAAENQGALPLFEPRALDYVDGPTTVTAYLSCFLTRYHPRASRWFDAFFKRVETSPRFNERWKKTFAERSEEMRERSFVSYMALEPGKTQIVYYPGKIQFRGGARKELKDWIPDTPKEFQTGARKDFAVIQDSTGLLGLLNGTFDLSDNFTRWEDDADKRRYGGFGFDGKVYRDAQPAMATFALYRDGTARLGTFASLPEKEKIATFVQNRFMVVEGGRAAKDSNPDAFFNYYDDIARSYLFVDKKGRWGFLWTLYTPPAVLTPLAIQMGVQDMMLLDIHSPLYASLSKPAGPLRYSGYRDYLKRSIDLVPNFFKMSSLKASLSWVSLAMNSQIQTPYAQEAFQMGSEDYFAIFLKDSPEAQRVQKSSSQKKGKKK